MLFRSNYSRFLFLCISAVFFLGDCSGFINLKRIGYGIIPGIDNTVLGSDTTTLSVFFDTAMDKLGTQKVLSVQVSGSSVKGDLFWRGDELVFSPLENWLPGVRYTLNLEGVIYALDGREERISKHISFYALHRLPSPYAVSFSPADGASVGVTSNENAFVSITFSQPMDRYSTVDAFSIEGAAERDYVWSAGDTVLEVHPKNTLNPWTVYRWNLTSKARGKNGVPMGRDIGGRFVTDADRTLPAVQEVFPLIRGGPDSGLWWLRTGAPIESGFGSGQAIGVMFTKAMDEATLRSIRFEPPLAGRFEMWKPDTIVFIPDRDPEPERTYTMIVSADSKDSGGLKMEKDFYLSFVADIPFLSILSLDAGFGGAVPYQYNIYPASAVLPEGICTIAIRFSHAIDAGSQSSIVLALRLETFFPLTLKPISFRSARWWSADTLILQWEGIEQSIAGEKHYYRLVLPGGRNGVTDGRGSYLREDMFFFLEIENGGP